MRRLGWLAALAGARPAQGGPLIDRLRERLAERQATGEPDDGSAAMVTAARAFTPPADISVERDIAYGSDPAQRLDVYRQSNPQDAPLILMVHGGGWRRGDKGGASMVANKVLHWVRKGCVFVSVNYRMVPAADPGQQADDIARALAFAQDQARHWGADPARCVLMGHSSGAHLVTLLGADGRIAARMGARPWLASVSIDSAAFDIEAIMGSRHFGLYDTAFGTDPARWREASPMHRLTGPPAAPMLLVCSARREDSCPPAHEFAAKASGFGGRVTVLPVDLGHLQINEQLGSPGAYTDAVDGFLRSVGLP